METIWISSQIWMISSQIPQILSLSQKRMHPLRTVIKKNPLEKETDLETVISPGVGLGLGTRTARTGLDGTGVIGMKEILILD